MSRIQPVRTAIVTGASSGIGRELVRQLVRSHASTHFRLIATARRLDRLETLSAEFPPGIVLPFEADLTQVESRKALIRFARDKFETLDLLVNNAGMGHYSPFERTESAAIRRVFALDVEALFDLTAEAILWMKPAGSGQIVQVSSILGEIGLPYSAVYVAAKHAVNGLVKSVRAELAGTGISMWAACPGQTVSEFRSVAGADDKADRGHLAESTENVVSGIVRGILRGHSRAFLYPTWQAWVIAAAAGMSPRMWERLMIRYRRRIALEDLGTSGPFESIQNG